jgi:glutathione synthase/RimK-type ligase-like ATP-grasp enzyme
MSNLATSPLPDLETVGVKLRDTIIKHGFVALELLLARLCRTPKLRILFSNVRRDRKMIERAFRSTTHEIHFAEFRPETVAGFDLVVPLDIDAVRRMDEMRAVLGHNALPIPARSAIDTCDDKLAFHRRMVASGLAEFVPRVDDGLAPPYVLKGRWGHSGQNTYLVLGESDARDLPADATSGDYFRQAVVPGRYEYSLHVLFIGGRVRRALCIEHDMEREISVKGRVRPRRQRIVRCPSLPVFARILTALEFEGLCNIDFKLRDGKPMVMEVNPRMGNSLCPYFFAFVRSLAPGNAKGA